MEREGNKNLLIFSVLVLGQSVVNAKHKRYTCRSHDIT